MKIKTIKAREILNSGATASIEVVTRLEDGACGRASVPFGVSAGSHEAHVLFDKDNRYAGKGMKKAARNVNTIIADALIGANAFLQKELDNTMREIDGTQDKSRLGANSILGVSLSIAHAASAAQNKELYEYIAQNLTTHPRRQNEDLPAPMIVVIEGGKHADNSTDFQEYLIVPQIKNQKGRLDVAESVRAGAEVYLSLKDVLQEKGFNTNVGNEGAYAPSGMIRNAEPWQLILEAISSAGYTAGENIMLAADPACSEIAVEQDSNIQYQLKREGVVFSSPDLIEYFKQWVDNMPFISLEDILFEDDWEHWSMAQQTLGEKVRLIGDDLLVTNPKRLKRAIQENSCNGILIKLNQIGTLTETIETIEMAKKAGFWTIVSHRGGGETNDTSMIDLAVACGSQMVKVGISRGERVCKYNRLMEIEEKINES